MSENKVVDSSLNFDISLNDTLEILEENKFEMSMEQLQDLINNFLPQDKLGLDMNKFERLSNNSIEFCFGIVYTAEIVPSITFSKSDSVFPL